jgi:glutathione S-transferase
MQVPDLVLYHNDMSVCAAKVRFMLLEKNIECTQIALNLRKGESQTPEYLKLNPNGVVPTLVHDSRPIVESNLILQYIDETWPEPALGPAIAHDRYRLRLWFKQLDDSIHPATGTVSSCIAFRFQHLEREPNELEAWLSSIPDPARQARTRAAIELGMESPGFAPAVRRFVQLFDDFEAALSVHRWIAGDAFTMADIAFSPYLERLEHLGFGTLFESRPLVANWFSRLRERQGHQRGVVAWFNPAYLAIFDRERPKVEAKLAELLKH